MIWAAAAQPDQRTPQRTPLRRPQPQCHLGSQQQKPPSQKKVKAITTSKHPHPRSFEKMKESPVFGVSKVKRPVAKLEGDAEGASVDVVEDDADNETVLKLRGYQLEGVNWLLWNWYNERSCILADEVCPVFVCIMVRLCAQY